MFIHRGQKAVLVLVLGVLWLPASAAPDLEVRKRVDVPTPAAQQPVEFTVDVRNIGADPARGVIVQDFLPAQLRIPAGLAAFPSVGSYDPRTGEWTVGDLNAGVGATLVIPAIIAVPDPPECIVNEAHANHANDPVETNNRARAALRSAGTDSCVDVQVGLFNTRIGPLVCGTTGNVDLDMRVTNFGPDTARNVVVDLTLSPALAPNLRFTAVMCAGRRCAIGSLAPGESVRLLATSDEFSNSSSRAYVLRVAASSDGADYQPDNNLVTRDGTIAPFEDCTDIDLPVAIGPECFIATAAYGSGLDPHVQALRDFRDRHLRHNALGRAFIRFYYRHSPPIAKYIERHGLARGATRVVLTPLVMAIVYPKGAGAVAVLVMAWYLRRQWVRGKLRTRAG